MIPIGDGFPPGVPAHLLCYVAVDDCDATVATATGLGGRTLAGPKAIAPGRFAVLADPQGAVFAVLSRDGATPSGA